MAGDGLTDGYVLVQISKHKYDPGKCVGHLRMTYGKHKKGTLVFFQGERDLQLGKFVVARVTRVREKCIDAILVEYVKPPADVLDDTAKAVAFMKKILK